MSDDMKALIEKARGLGGLSSTVQSVVNGLADALEASVQAPAVDRDALTEFLHNRQGFEYDQCDHGFQSGSWVKPGEKIPYAMCERWADAIIASGILQDAAEVEARGLEKAAVDALSTAAFGKKTTTAWSWLRARAQQVREGDTK